MNQNRPVNLKLTSIHFPLAAIVSILHRISGVILFLSVPLMLWALQQTLGSQTSFSVLYQQFLTPLGKFITWIVLSCVTFHSLSGIRHLFMDLGFCEEKESGRFTSQLVLILAAIFIVFLGVWLCWQ